MTIPQNPTLSNISTDLSHFELIWINFRWLEWQSLKTPPSPTFQLIWVILRWFELISGGWNDNPSKPHPLQHFNWFESFWVNFRWLEWQSLKTPPSPTFQLIWVILNWFELIFRWLEWQSLKTPPSPTFQLIWVILSWFELISGGWNDNPSKPHPLQHFNWFESFWVDLS